MSCGLRHAYDFSEFDAVWITIMQNAQIHPDIRIHFLFDFDSTDHYVMSPTLNEPPKRYASGTILVTD